MTELDEIRQAVRRLWADFPRLSSDAPVPRRVSPARGWTDEYGGVEYGGLPVKYVVLHQMNQGPPTARTLRYRHRERLAAVSLAPAEITTHVMRRAKRDDVPSPWWPRFSVEYARSVCRTARCDNSLTSEALVHRGPHRRVTTSRAQTMFAALAGPCSQCARFADKALVEGAAAAVGAATVGSSAFRCQPVRRNGLQINSAVAPQRSAGAFYRLLLSPPASQARTWP
jgi:hypothetical protein